MGWGTTVLGYCHPEVQQAVRSAMGSAPLLAYPRPIQAEVQNLLARDFPGTTGIAFGKNGSDVCTLAARLCRGYTGRKTISYCGYHGWGDFWAEQHGFSRSSIPERHPSPDSSLSIQRYTGLHEAVRAAPERSGGGHARTVRTLGRQRGRVRTGRGAGVPGNIAVGDEKCGCAAGIRRDHHRLSVPGRQRAASTRRDARSDVPGKGHCLGNASIRPARRADIMEKAFGRAHYGPTFQAEAWSLAAAKATIEVFRREAVALHVWKQGEALKHGIDEALRVAGIPGEVKGPPFRMSVCFTEEQGEVRELQRTLLQQETASTGHLDLQQRCDATLLCA